MNMLFSAIFKFCTTKNLFEFQVINLVVKFVPFFFFMSDSVINTQHCTNWTYKT